MSALELLADVGFNPNDYNANEWFVEQDSFRLCSYNDEAIDIPVLIISEYTLAHYKYYISIVCETNLDDFYECLGNQPLKMVFSHLIDDDYVIRHGYNVYPDTNLNRNYVIKKNELYLDSNEVELDTEDNQLVGHGDYIDEDEDEDEIETDEEESDSDDDEDYAIETDASKNGGGESESYISRGGETGSGDIDDVELEGLERVEL